MLTLTALENWHICMYLVLMCNPPMYVYVWKSRWGNLYGISKRLCTLHLKNRVLWLLCTLYGLKQTGLAWWNELNELMKELGFERLKTDAGLFIYKEGNLIVIAIIYMDNTLFCGPSKALIKKIKAAFMKIWKCHNLGKAKEFLWMNIHWDGHHLHIDQHKYLKKVLEHCAKMIKPACTPLPQGYQPEMNTPLSTQNFGCDFRQW